VVQMLENKGSSIENLVTAVTTAVYRESTKTVVTVDVGNLQKIREEALVTQEKLTVPEEEEWSMPAHWQPDVPQSPGGGSMPAAEAPLEEPVSGPWAELKQVLSKVELQALGVLLQDASGFKAFADAKGIMQEVLADGINEKAMDVLGDGLMDEEFVLYEDYIEEVRKLVEE